MAAIVPAYVSDAALAAQLEHEVALDGCRLYRARDGADLSRAMRRPDAFVALVDATMPGVDVEALLDHKRAGGIRAEVVVLHAPADTGVARAAEALGAFACLPRNATVRAIAATVRLAIARMERERLLMDSHEQLERARQRHETLALDIKRRLLQSQSKVNSDGFRAGTAGVRASAGDVDFVGPICPTPSRLEWVLGTVHGTGDMDDVIAAAALKQDYLRLMAARNAGDDDARPDLADLLDALVDRAEWNGVVGEGQPDLAVGRFDAESGQLSMLTTGSPCVLLYGADSRSARPVRPRAATQGAVEARAVELQVEPGDIVAVCSAGLPGARSRTVGPFGQDELGRILAAHAARPPWELADALLAAAVQHCGGARYARADMSCIVLDLQPVHASEGTVLALDRCIEELRRVRAFCRDLAAPVLTHEATQRLVLAADETMSNIVRHAGGDHGSEPVEIHGHRNGDSVEVEFRYAGRSFAPAVPSCLPDAEEYPEGGFGLYIIDHTADGVSYERGEDGRNRVRLTVCGAER